MGTVRIVLAGDAAALAQGLVASLVESQVEILPGDGPDTDRGWGEVATELAVAIVAHGTVETISTVIKGWLKSRDLPSDSARVEEVEDDQDDDQDGAS